MSGNGSQRAVGFIGKVPARPDFVRRNIGVSIGTELDRWLVASTQAMQHGRVELPDSPVGFVFGATGEDSVAIGVLKRSSDKAGRSFPLAIFTSLPSVEAARACSALPLAYAGFLAGAVDVLDASVELSAEALTERVLSLVPPTAAELESHQAVLSGRLKAVPAAELLDGLFGGDAVDARDYAVYTLCAATGRTQEIPAPGAATVLDCPVHVTGAHSAWLELIARRLRWGVCCPTFAFTELPRSRMLVALGFAPEQLLQLVAEPESRNARLWPLTTQRPEAVQRAREALGTAAASEVGAEESLDAYWTRLTSVQVG